MTLGESPFPEPQFPCLESEEGTERPPKSLPVIAAHTQAKVRVNPGNEAELEVFITSGLFMLIGSSLELPEMRQSTNITAVLPLVVLVVSKALKAGEGLHAEDRRPGLADGLGTFHCRVQGMGKFPKSSPKAHPWAWTTLSLEGRWKASAAPTTLTRPQSSPEATLPPANLKMPEKKSKTSLQTNLPWNGRPAVLRRSGTELMSGFYSISYVH